jgi:tRNA 5-methylaminomethyl-2-thiouridine biosynthesis bifunctional protein
MFIEAEIVVLANAGDCLRLLGGPAWPVEAIRGQLTGVASSVLTRQGQSLPRLPIAGSGYLLPDLDGTTWFGATSQADDADVAVRVDDHRLNIAQLERLLGRPLALDPQCADGRTAWRWSSRDRLPVVGGVPDFDCLHAALAGLSDLRLDQPRFVPRLPGLFVFSALGSRGITWSALAAQVLAAWVSGAPMPLEADLLDAIDPARFAIRALRRRQP